MDKNRINIPNILTETPQNGQAEYHKCGAVLKLDADWSFRQANTDNWLGASVPGTNFTDLLNNGQIQDPFYRDNENNCQWIENEDWEYKTVFYLQEDQLQYDQVTLVFEGLDTYADVYLNGHLILQAFNMFLEYAIDCKDELIAGANELLIYFHSPLKKALPLQQTQNLIYPASNDKTQEKLSVFTRKAPYHYGWDWGPKFVTSGIWRPVYLQFRNLARINHLRIQQNSLSKNTAHLTSVAEINALTDGKAKLVIRSETGAFKNVEHLVYLKKGDNIIHINFNIENPEWWWPACLGKPALYKITIELLVEDVLIARTSKKIGLRTIEVINEKDEMGESFYFKINGIPLFIKGANYIPPDSFMPRVSKEKYGSIIDDALEANMNMLRVWGGGVYEDEYFYDLADEKGILIWQDFMFACTMYPGDEAFLDNVKEEVIYNIRRLRHHPSLAIWCGNNEIDIGWHHWGWQEEFGYDDITYQKMYEDYKKTFEELIPQLVKTHDASRFYLPSSPISYFKDIDDFKVGDNHYWGVWHGEQPFDEFNHNIPRFMSEFGFQSFPAFESVKKYTLPEDWDINSKVMTVHQKHPKGNQLISEYMDDWYRSPKDFEAFLYLSQLLQATGMKIAFEAHRRAKPFCMGSLYWQLNDCWPVASWSGIDYYGNWKALHYQAKRSFREIILSFEDDDEIMEVFIVSDRQRSFEGKLQINLLDFNGRSYQFEEKPVNIPADSSDVYFVLDKEEILKQHDLSQLVLEASLIMEEQVITDCCYFVLPKEMQLTHHDIKIDTCKVGAGYKLILKSDVLAKNVCLKLPERVGKFSDNFFDILPGKPVEIFYITQEDPDFSSELIVCSLIDTYLQ